MLSPAWILRGLCGIGGIYALVTGINMMSTPLTITNVLPAAQTFFGGLLVVALGIVALVVAASPKAAAAIFRVFVRV